MDFKKLADKAKKAIDDRGGTEALKGDLQELKTVAQGKGTLKEKAQAAAERLKTPGAAPADPAPPTAQDLPPRS
jgi:hypothetical protein